MLKYLLFIFEALALSGPMAMSPNMKYAFTGKQVLSMSSEITTVWTAESPLLVTITYNAPGSGTLQVAAILSDFGLANINAGINVIFTPKVLTQTNMVVNITSTHPSNLIKLSISYIVFINRQVYGKNSIAQGGIATVGKNVSSVSSWAGDLDLNNNINMTGNISVFLVLIGIVAQPTSSSNVINFENNVQFLNNSYVRISTTSTSSTPTYIQILSLFIFAFNDNFFMSTNYFNYHIFPIHNTQNQNHLTVNDSNYQLLSFNTIIGLNSLSISGQNSFSLFYTANYSLIISSDKIISFTVTALVFYTYYCDYRIPYYYDSQCYDQCPQGTSTDHSHLECVSSSSVSIIGIVVGVSVGSILLIVIIVVIICKCNNTPEEQQTLGPKPIQPLPSGEQIHVIQPEDKPIQFDQPPKLPLWNPISSIMSPESNRQCCICWKGMPIEKCQHIFHLQCLNKWQNEHKQYENGKCPACKVTLFDQFQCQLCHKKFKQNDTTIKRCDECRNRP